MDGNQIILVAAALDPQNLFKTIKFMKVLFFQWNKTNFVPLFMTSETKSKDNQKSWGNISI